MDSLYHMLLKDYAPDSDDTLLQAFKVNQSTIPVVLKFNQAREEKDYVKHQIY